VSQIAWAISIAIMVCAVSYCSVQIDAQRRMDGQAKAEFCVKNGGVWTYGWGNPWCEYAHPAKGGET
jgi:hypothetical protein